MLLNDTAEISLGTPVKTPTMFKGSPRQEIGDPITGKTTYWDLYQTFHNDMEIITFFSLMKNRISLGIPFFKSEIRKFLQLLDSETFEAQCAFEKIDSVIHVHAIVAA